jgi:cellulose synthase/poly-beta-1,6-N-acetylglucosamine synthase-like glycosyltransferase
MLSILLLCLAGGYCALMLFVATITRKLKVSPERNDVSISVIVCARNEAQRLQPLLESLTRLEYPTDQYEIILVDDDSSDKTQTLMQTYAQRFPHWHVLRHIKQPGEPQGKKAALTMGISHAKGEIILTTDADCQVPVGWLKSMAGYFEPEVGMVLGFAIVKSGQSLFERLQQFGCVCEATVAAVSAYYQRPTHSNGQNLAYRKAIFTEVGGYTEGAQISSGDDFFLSKAIQTRSKWRFAFNISPSSFVTTLPEKWGRQFIHQQLRRNGKAFYLPPLHFFLASWVFLFHVGLGVALLMAPALFGSLVVLKFLVELVAFRAGAKLFGQTILLRDFPIFWVLYPMQIIGFAVLGSFQRYRWK